MFKNYLKIAWKILLRRKFFTGISLFGISFTLMVLMIVTTLLDQVIGPVPPVPDVNRMLFASMMELSGEGSTSSSSPSYDFLKRYVKPLKTPELVTVHSRKNIKNAYSNEKLRHIQVKYTDEVFWQVYDFRFLNGKPYGIRELEAAEPVVVISEKIRQEFFSEGEALGQVLPLGNARYRVIGVVEDVMGGMKYAYAEVWIPHTTVAHKVNDMGVFGDYRVTVLARSRRDFGAIKAEYQRVVEQIDVPDPERFDTIYCPLESIEEQLIRQVLGFRAEERALPLFYALSTGAVLLFMTLPATNLINLNVSRIAERASEIGVRKAFGATRGTLTGQFVVENIILTLLGGGIGVMMSLIILYILAGNDWLPYAELTLNVRVLGLYLGFCLLFGIFSGVYPAYKMSRLHPVEALTGGRS